jgi:hypothetical protein
LHVFPRVSWLRYSIYVKIIASFNSQKNAFFKAV